MLSPHTLLSLILAVLGTVDASPVSRSTGKATLSIATRTNRLGAFNVVERDRARIQALIQRGQVEKRSAPSAVADNIFGGYTVEVGVGSPPTNYTLQVDTGSSVTWIGAGKSYVKTSTSQDTGNPVAVKYGNSSFTGEIWNDTITVAPGLAIKQQSIGVASNFSGSFTGYDGILGLGPVAQTSHSVRGGGTIPTVMDNLFSQEAISQEVLGVYFVPSAEPVGSGELTFGGCDESVLASPVVYTPLIETKPANNYWSFEQSISYGFEAIMPRTVGIVDTGTTFTYIPSDAFEKYRTKTGATFDSDAGLYWVTPDQFDRLEPLVFYVEGQPLTLMPDAQIWPRSLTYSSNMLYLVINDIAFQPSFNLGFINGYTFLQRFYSVYDTTKERVGFGATRHTFSNPNYDSVSD